MHVISDESAFWAMKGLALASGINPARMGQLAKFCADFKRARGLLDQALKAKNPSTYLGALIKSLRDELAPPRTLNEPEIALDARLRGWPVRKTSLSNGDPGWWIAGVLYNARGDDVGR